MNDTGKDTLVKLALVIAVVFYFIEGLDKEWSVWQWIHWLSIIFALTVINMESLVSIGEAACQAFATIGEAVASFVAATYKFVLSPLVRGHRAKEDNYKEIIRGLQKELSRGNER